VRPVTVSEVSEYIKSLLENDRNLGNICIKGEISNFKAHSSGHLYFSLKDEGAVISAVMFRGMASRLRFRPENGMKVFAYGRISSFPRSGQYQIYVNDLQPDGVGALFVAFEQLKSRLAEEGLFDKELKKPLPQYPGRIALLTSPTGAAVRDMIRILRARYPLAEVIVCPVQVQGPGAAEQIAAMLDYVNRVRLADLIITGRGGGSLEDLWAFNEEVLARAIFRSEIPVISAVGHEPDVTIADYVADLRAATPSNAAELAVPDREELWQRVRALGNRMYQLERARLREDRLHLTRLADSKIMRSPYAYLEQRRLRLDLLEQQMTGAFERMLNQKKARYARAAATLDAISPLKVIARGYSMASREGTVVRSVKQLEPGDTLKLRLADGTAACTVDAITENK